MTALPKWSTAHATVASPTRTPVRAANITSQQRNQPRCDLYATARDVRNNALPSWPPDRRKESPMRYISDPTTSKATASVDRNATVGDRLQSRAPRLRCPPRRSAGPRAENCHPRRDRGRCRGNRGVRPAHHRDRRHSAREGGVVVTRPAAPTAHHRRRRRPHAAAAVRPPSRR